MTFWTLPKGGTLLWDVTGYFTFNCSESIIFIIKTRWKLVFLKEKSDNKSKMMRLFISELTLILSFQTLSRTKLKSLWQPLWIYLRISDVSPAGSAPSSCLIVVVYHCLVVISTQLLPVFILLQQHTVSTSDHLWLPFGDLVQPVRGRQRPTISGEDHFVSFGSLCSRCPVAQLAQLFGSVVPAARVADERLPTAAAMFESFVV